jgi:hypothetical protein
MARLVPAIHVLFIAACSKTWMPGTRPGMTQVGHFIACGLIGEPVPPVIASGGPQKKNS